MLCGSGNPSISPNLRDTSIPYLCFCSPRNTSRKKRETGRHLKYLFQRETWHSLHVLFQLLHWAMLLTDVNINWIYFFINQTYEKDQCKEITFLSAHPHWNVWNSPLTVGICKAERRVRYKVGCIILSSPFSFPLPFLCFECFTKSGENQGQCSEAPNLCDWLGEAAANTLEIRMDLKLEPWLKLHFRQVRRICIDGGGDNQKKDWERRMLLVKCSVGRKLDKVVEGEEETASGIGLWQPGSS